MEEGNDSTGAAAEDETLIHQPPNPTDLRRHPPASAECARFRALLRDYADQELEPALRDAVDEHAHGCRECGVALSRVEAEVYRLQRSLKVPVAEPGDDFVRRVMARVRADQASAPAAAEDEAAVSPDFTPRVMERIRREWKRPSLGRRAGRFARRHAVSVLTIAAVAVIAVWLRLGMGPDISALQVISAEHATVRRANHAFELAAGDVLQPGEAVDVALDGRVVIALPHGQDGGDRARLEFDGDSAFVVLQRGEDVRAPLFQLRAGTVDLRVQAEEGIQLAIGDGCRIELEPGQFRVFAEDVTRHDGRLAFEPSFTGVRLAAVSGRAYIVRGRNPRITLEAGHAALFDPWSAVEFERCLDETELAARIAHRDVARSEPASEPVRARGDWLGRVISAQSTAGVAGASVTLRLPGHAPRIAFTRGDGMFELEGLDVENVAAIVEVSLPEGSPADFGNLANLVAPITLRPVGVGPQGQSRLAPIRLPAERRVMGTVFDPDRRQLAGARVAAVAIDTLAGSAKRLSAAVAEAVTDAQGRFVLRRLPAALPAYVDVYLLVEHAQHGAIAALDLLAEPSVRDQAIEVTMVRRERVALADLPAGTALEIFTSIRNLAPSAMLQVHHVRVSAAGTAELDVAQGASLWLRQGATLLALAPSQERLGAFLPLAAAVPPTVIALAAQQRSGRSTVVEGGRWRYDEVVTGGTERRTIALVDRDGRDLAGGRLFVARSNGLAYLGDMTGAQGEWFLPAGSDYRVVVLSEDGSIGMVEAAQAQDEMLRVQMLAPGGARLPEDLVSEVTALAEQRGGFLVFELVMAEPLRDHVVYRHAGRDSSWQVQGLVPGSYRLVVTPERIYTADVPPGGLGQFVRYTGEPEIR